jgi:YD repeat-containing protein
VDGNETAVINPLGGRTHYAYDFSDRVISETTPSGGTPHYGYNALSLLSELTNARGQKRNYIYDDAGR